MKLIMPMAGDGTRFADAGYTQPKPLIPINGVPMFAHAERCIELDFDERIFIVRKEHDINSRVLEWYPDATVIELDYLTEGTACSILTAREHYEDGSSIFVANCDQHIEWDSYHAQEIMDTPGVDGLIPNFHCPGRSPKWSYAMVDDRQNIKRVAEKDPISEWATVGYYYWRDGQQFIQSVDMMMSANDRVNNEFYTCPVYNYTLKIPGIGNVKHIEVDVMQGIGTPEDVKEYETVYCT
jgi:NDP-sugar pyrophosphorylase family protein